MKWIDGTYYEGEWNLGYAEGKGILVYVNGDYMKGQFMYNKLNGYGECYNNELCYEYKGYWENDQQSGQGILIRYNRMKINCICILIIRNYNIVIFYK